MKTAFIFPGQGSQFVGMGKEVDSPLFDRANEVLGRDLKKIMFDGPEEALKETSNTQPALYVASMAVLEKVKRWGVVPDYVAGHSLGEYSALAAAEVFSFEDGLQLVQARANAMSEQAQASPGAMAAILGMDDAAVEKVCAGLAGSEVLQCANFNSPGQVVISGHAAAVEKAMESLKAAGALKCIRLAVSGAFHSPLMKPAGDALAKAFPEVSWQMPKIPVVCNVDGAVCGEIEGIQHRLVQQISAPVLWSQSMRWLSAQGVTHMLEIGSGKVLQGLMKKIDKAVQVASIGDAASLEKGWPWPAN